MTRWLSFGRDERVRRQASRWIAKLNGPDGQAHRASFEHWYRASPGHAAAYDRLSALFAAARSLDPAGLDSALRPAPPSVGFARPALAVGGTLGVALLIGLAVYLTGAGSPGVPDAQHARFASAESASRRIVLVDGSEVALAPGSELVVAIDASARQMRLTAGEARFAVRHDPRPFVVAARDARVVAKGTEFVVRITGRGTFVSLIKGRVEVSYPGVTGRPGRRTTMLTAGQQVMIAPSAPARPEAAATSPSPDIVEFDDTRLAEAIARMNQRGTGRVRLADPRLGEVRITGAFATRDPGEFAAAVATALGLVAEPDGEGTVWLRQRPGVPLADRT